MEPAFEIAKLIAICLTALLSLFLYLKYGNKIQLTEAIKSKALGDVFFLYEATPRIYKTEKERVLELEVKISNQSLSKLAILAIFVKYKPLVSNSKQNFIESIINFDKLENFTTPNQKEEDVSILNNRNIAFANGFFWQTSVNGVSVRRGFDIIPDEFCKQYPIIMSQIVIYGASTKYIDKTHFPKYRIDKLRVPFCNFLAEKNIENYDFFARMSKEGYINKNNIWVRLFKYFGIIGVMKSIKLIDYFEINEGERIFVHQDGSLDVQNTRLFFPILKSTINSNIEKIIDFNLKNT
ncbi:MAG: hypothetical protein IPN15_09105 [Saprospiraceae bacterium]|nr:hypothetical protein [Bacteroidota bacterium]MBK7302925.1 hypothetical protein [Candidatus Vicinibacter affinis]MBK8642352.1 hypothetical protein [Candidatus Vicinibacter affinis]